MIYFGGPKMGVTFSIRSVFRLLILSANQGLETSMYQQV